MLAETTVSLLNGLGFPFRHTCYNYNRQGKNFLASNERAFPKDVGSHRIHSGSFHPQKCKDKNDSTGISKVLFAHGDTGWSDILPIVLLELRSAMKNFLKATSSQLVYGTIYVYHLFHIFRISSNICDTHFCFKLKTLMKNLAQYIPVSHSCTKSYVHQSLSKMHNVFFRNKNCATPLTPPYTGPHLVKSRSDKDFVICINNKNVTVTIDRCKPAFEFSEDFNSQKGSSNFEPPLTKQQIEDKTVVDKNIRTTRSGRHVHFPKRLTY
ncbi:transposon Tf2-9 polyprotein [Trichonephila inaurata madagascariensis]|uniref:Transposon Tf2-9 polyprotein n=1 Tax=Trichonephila inaurata madagascariensis TaxID=2747483 RepID=A0A8X6XKJ0_9ARAC|nr:transposon Tf2-9 polyprotein [Trichonephila inaurata madagascariensis]